MKRTVLLSFFCGLLPALALGAQEITRFAVVDMNKVYSSFQNDTKSTREWNERTERLRKEVEKRKAEIQELVDKRTEAAEAAAEADVKRLGIEIERKTAALKSYYDGEVKKLEEQKPRVTKGQEFLNQVYNALRVVSESEGYSMVLNLQESKGIAWYSQAIDITDKVIAHLRSRSAR